MKRFPLKTSNFELAFGLDFTLILFSIKSWQPAKQVNGEPLGYIISYNRNGTKDWHAHQVHGDHRSTVVRNLRPETVYYFKAQVRNKKGIGPFSSPVMFRTAMPGKFLFPLLSGPFWSFLSQKKSFLVKNFEVLSLQAATCRKLQQRKGSYETHDGY